MRMEFPQYESQWHGVSLLQFPAAKDAQDKPAGPEFYRQFYEELEKHPLNPVWVAGKAAFGPVCIRKFFKPWERQHGRKPKILSLGVGRGFIEEVWLSEGYDVTLQECQDFSLRRLHAKYPNARLAIGDAAAIQFDDKFDFVAIMALDSCLSRADLSSLLQHARSWLTQDGQVLFHSCGSLSLRRMLAEAVNLLRRTIAPRPQVFWGWWRTVGELCRLGERAGLRVADVYRFSGGEDSLTPRNALTRRLPTLKSPLIVILFGASDSPPSSANR
jgi:hypothetical protein